MLLSHLQSQFPEPIGQRVFVNLLDVAVSQVAMRRVPGLPNDVAQLHNVLHGSFPFSVFVLCYLCLFVAILASRGSRAPELSRRAAGSVATISFPSWLF